MAKLGGDSVDVDTSDFVTRSMSSRTRRNYETNMSVGYWRRTFRLKFFWQCAENDGDEGVRKLRHFSISNLYS